MWGIVSIISATLVLHTFDRYSTCSCMYLLTHNTQVWTGREIGREKGHKKLKLLKPKKCFFSDLMETIGKTII